MARKTLQITISEDGRDKGQQFEIEEMSAYDAERWAWRVGMALGNAGVDIGDVQTMSMEQMAMIGLNALFHVNSEESWALSERLIECVYILPDPSKPMNRRKLTADDIQEPKTRLYLKWEVFRLHTGFSLGGGNSTSTSGISETAASNMQMSQLPSGRSSPRARRGSLNARASTG